MMGKVISVQAVLDELDELAREYPINMGVQWVLDDLRRWLMEVGIDAGSGYCGEQPGCSGAD